MRVKVNVILIALLYLVLSCETESDSDFKDYFIRYYGKDGDQHGIDLVVNTDGSLMLLGQTVFPPGNKRIYLLKTDGNGNVILEKELGELTENPKDIEPIIAGTYAGGYLILSNTETSPGSTAIKVIRVDAGGNKIDSIKIDASYLPSNYGNSVTPLLDGGFIVTGNTADVNVLLADNGLIDPPDQTDLLSLRYDDNVQLDPAWLNSFGGEPETVGIKIFEVNATQFDFAGYTNAVHSGEPPLPDNFDFNFWFVRLNSSGSNGLTEYIGSALTLQEQQDELMTSIARSSSGQYMAIGSTDIAGVQRIFAARIIGFPTSDRIKIWDVPFIDPEGEGISISATNGGKFLIVGNQTKAGGSRDIWLTKVNIEINEEEGFPRSFGSDGNDDTASAVAELPNGDIVVLGTMELTNQKKIALIKLKSNGGF